MAFTVTATQSGSSAGISTSLQVRVLTGAVAAGGAGNGGTSAANVASAGSLTPAASHSLPVFSISADSLTGVLPAAAASNTYYTNANNASENWSYAFGFYSGTVTAGTPLTYGCGSAAGSDHGNWCAYEILPAGGTTPAVDGSSPAAVATTSSAAVTTASFTPPAGAVLAALITAGGTGAGAGVTMTVTDTSGLGLTWTQRAVSSTSDNFQPTWVYTASLAAGTPAGLASGAGAALNPSIVLSTITVGPNYAGTGTDLGGVYGSWGTPQFATGGP